jgi:hypothetical protein
MNGLGFLFFYFFFKEKRKMKDWSSLSQMDDDDAAAISWRKSKKTKKLETNKRCYRLRVQ